MASEQGMHFMVIEVFLDGEQVELGLTTEKF